MNWRATRLKVLMVPLVHGTSWYLSTAVLLGTSLPSIFSRYILRTPPSSSIDVKESLVLIILIMSTYRDPGPGPVTVLFTRLREY